MHARLFSPTHCRLSLNQRVTDGEFTMMTITDTGSTGDLEVTGSGLFGGDRSFHRAVLCGAALQAVFLLCGGPSLCG